MTDRIAFIRESRDPGHPYRREPYPTMYILSNENGDTIAHSFEKAELYLYAKEHDIHVAATH